MGVHEGAEVGEVVNIQVQISDIVGDVADVGVLLLEALLEQIDDTCG